MLTLRNNIDADEVNMKAFNEAMEKVKPNKNDPGEEMVQYL